MCVVDFQPGPRICLAYNFHEVVFPTPGGPVISKWGGSEERLAAFKVFRMFFGMAISSNVRGAFDINQLGIVESKKTDGLNSSLMVDK